MSKVIIVAGGDAPRELPGCDFLIAADSGLDAVMDLGVIPDLVVGDFDSASPTALDWYKDTGRPFEQHPAAKDATDLQIAFDALDRFEPTSVDVFGVWGGRVDHSLTNVAVCCGYRTAPVVMRTDVELVHIVRGQKTLVANPGSTVSLIAWGGSAVVSIDDVEWPLTNAELSPFTSLGQSNLFLGESAEVQVHSGLVLAIVKMA